jgi:hypothetical protein
MRLGAVIADWRWANRIGVREATKLMGVSAATLSRLECGKNCDGDTLAKLLLWLLEPGKKLERLRAKGDGT